ncbi:hypothetical protein RHSIM_Rhsim05G0035800 [Rhododendron simsii]|uniref:Uncharacterized protein n=1 Tax=Rhododendron simsii TaxID=118357 RepID=A0A834GY03_RHOSS|nr:hypothetical protein RHSIM_Rhsim05G0035800 [Rhododendron simsii]
MGGEPVGQNQEANVTPSHHVQTGMGGEPVGQNQEANMLGHYFMGGPIALDTESGLIMVARPHDQHGEKNTSTAWKVPSHNVETGMEIEPIGQNQEANVFRQYFTEGPTALHTENGLIIGIVKTPPFHDSYPGNYPTDYKENENAGSSSEWASQVNDQSTLSTPYQNHNALVFPQPQITSMLSENRGGSIDWRNSLASQAEPFSDRHISGSSNLAFPTWSDQAAPSQHAEGQSVQSTVYPAHNAVHCFPQGHVFGSINWNEHTNSLASQAEPFSDRQISGSSNLTFPTLWRPPDQLEGQTMQFTAHPNPNALGLPQFQIASSQGPSANEDRRNSLTSQDEAFFIGRVSESSNLAFPTYSDAAAPSQPVATILTERQDTSSVKKMASKEELELVHDKGRYKAITFAQQGLDDDKGREKAIAQEESDDDKERQRAIARNTVVGDPPLDVIRKLKKQETKREIGAQVIVCCPDMILIYVKTWYRLENHIRELPPRKPLNNFPLLCQMLLAIGYLQEIAFPPP